MGIIGSSLYIQQMDQIWVTTTDEEVEILSTNDGSAN